MCTGALLFTPTLPIIIHIICPLRVDAVVTWGKEKFLSCLVSPSHYLGRMHVETDVVKTLHEEKILVLSGHKFLDNAISPLI